MAVMTGACLNDLKALEILLENVDVSRTGFAHLHFLQWFSSKCCMIHAYALIVSHNLPSRVDYGGNCIKLYLFFFFDVISTYWKVYLRWDKNDTFVLYNFYCQLMKISFLLVLNAFVI